VFIYIVDLTAEGYSITLRHPLCHGGEIGVDSIAMSATLTLVLPAHNEAGNIERKVMFSGDRLSRVIDIEPHHAEELVKFLERNAGLFPGPSD
jgi:hypothetical protein